MMYTPHQTSTATASPRQAKARSAEELEEIMAEGQDWFGEGYEFACSYIEQWKDGKIALGKPVEAQPATGLANKLWRQGFNKRIQEHMTAILSSSGMAAAPEVDRWNVGIARSMSRLPEDWRLIGRDCAERHVHQWRDGRLALAAPVQGKPADPQSIREWRAGFDQRIEEFVREVPPHEVARWRKQLAAALGEAAPDANDQHAS